MKPFLILTRLVEADAVNAARDVDGPGRDAVDGLPLEPLLRVHGADGHGRWQRRWHHDGDQVQGLQRDLAEGLAVKDLRGEVRGPIGDAGFVWICLLTLRVALLLTLTLKGTSKYWMKPIKIKRAFTKELKVIEKIEFERQ